MSKRPEMLEYALWYAAHDIPVFPLHSACSGKCSCRKGFSCEHPGKHPRTRHGFKVATTVAVQIRKWWKQWPEANIGAPTGEASGFLVVDCDPRNQGPVDRSELIEQFGPIPETAEATTGGGGRHYYFRYTGGPVPKTLMPGVDLKGNGGYVVVPPSVHQSGNPYEWDGMNDREALLSLAEVPAWLRERIAAQSNHRTPFIATAPRPARQMLTSDLDKWMQGERNDRLMSLAGALRRNGLTQPEIEAELLMKNRRCCDPPLEDTEVRKVAKSAARYPAGDPSGHRPDGFIPPGYDDAYPAFLDVIRFTADLPGFKVLLFLVERTLGYGKAADCVSISQMVGGVYSPKLGTWIRKGCGLSKASVTKEIRSLAAPDLPLVLANLRSSPARGHEPTEYEVNWPVLTDYIVRKKQEAAPPCPPARQAPPRDPGSS